jgi:hypothetical protein
MRIPLVMAEQTLAIERINGGMAVGRRKGEEQKEGGGCDPPSFMQKALVKYWYSINLDFVINNRGGR